MKNLKTRKAAKYIGVSHKTLEAWRVSGHGPQFLKLGPGKKSLVFYRQVDLDDYLNGQLRTSTSDPGPGASDARPAA